MKSHEPAGQMIRQAAAGRLPRVGLILGSGLAELANRVENPAEISYKDLPGYPMTTVEGHVGRLVIGDWAGARVACMQGRFHVYEGYDPVDLVLPIRALQAAGCDVLVLTCAAGSLREKMPPGSLMTLTDHINWSGISPLAGPNDDDIGPRFLDLNNAYDPQLRTLLQDAARDAGITLHEGVYIWCLGPNFETPAEIRAFRSLGADVVGMSTVPECLAARHCGMRVAAVSVITNLAAGMQPELFHAETLAAGEQATPRLGRLIESFLGLLDKTT
ncbi:MAG: purine-nucleoside phosphorylase, partial [Pseudomonadota bacterium]|nr:purine-nucleoside phosphorylase [Pseudomonadota bacterium]